MQPLQGVNNLVHEKGKTETKGKSLLLELQVIQIVLEFLISYPSRGMDFLVLIIADFIDNGNFGYSTAFTEHLMQQTLRAIKVTQHSFDL